MTQDGWKMVVNLPPGAAVTVTRDNAPSLSALPERTSSRVAKRTFDTTFGGSIFTPQLACADPAVSAVREDLEAMWPAEDTEGSETEDTCLCLCAKEVDPSYLTTGIDEGSDAEPDDYADESDVDEAELDAETAAVWSTFMDARPGILHKSTMSCFYSERELGVIKEAFEILTGVIGEPDLCQVEGNRWALEAKEKEEEGREAKKRKTEEGPAVPDTEANIEAPPPQDVQMQDVEAPVGDSAAASSVAPVAPPAKEDQSQDPKATAQDAAAETATPQSTTSQKSLASQFSPWTFVSDEEKPKKAPERKLLPPTDPWTDDEDDGGSGSGSEGSWIPQDA